MADIVEKVLREAAEKSEQFKTTDVSKDLELDIDVGSLLAIDQNPIDVSKFRKNEDEYLKKWDRDNTQLLINKIWELPSERLEEAIIVKLPDPKTLLPRAKPVPKLKQPTKWQEFARSKGIQKRKKDKLVWDKNTKQWHPRYGYRRAPEGNEDWVMEYKQNQDPYEDLFAKKSEEKKERVAKNELQRLRNIARNQKKKVPGVGLTPTEVQTPDSLSKAASVAQISTASLGNFNEQNPKDKPIKQRGIKRKFEPVVGNSLAERKRNLDIMDKIKSNEPKIDLEKAANSFTHGEQVMQAEKNIMGNRKGKPKAGKGKASGGKGKKGGNKFQSRQFAGKKGGTRGRK